ncbi:MAG: chemotaxis protein CheD [Spirochaetaceae bacterium]|nr:chemotaxis protein CheD [Spirochaetaceae bacterium]
MFRHTATRFEQEVVTIHPGEYYATAEDTIVATVLGSCIAVGLFDPAGKAGGLNHFMLPAPLGSSDFPISQSAKYGMYAMELLMNDLMKLGVRRTDVRAKVFGGGAVLKIGDYTRPRIAEGNIDFAFEYLKKEGIPVVASDVGGVEPRKIFFYTRGGKVLLKRIGGTLVNLVAKDEERYLQDIQHRKHEGPIVLFTDPP